MSSLSGLVVVFSTAAAWAWLKSAALSLGKLQPTFMLDRWMNAISTSPQVWNAIAAFAAALAAIAQGIIYLIQNPMGQ